MHFYRRQIYYPIRPIFDSRYNTMNTNKQCIDLFMFIINIFFVNREAEEIDKTL